MCFDLTHASVATAARSAATGLVSTSTRPDPEGSDTMEIATRRCPRLRVVRDLRELTHEQKPRRWSLPARVGPVTVHPTRGAFVLGVLVVYQIGTRHIARAFGKMGLDEQSVGGPDRFLPSTIMLDPPGQRLKLPDGPTQRLATARVGALPWKSGNNLGWDFLNREC